MKFTINLDVEKALASQQGISNLVISGVRNPKSVIVSDNKDAKILLMTVPKGNVL